MGFIDFIVDLVCTLCFYYAITYIVIVFLYVLIVWLTRSFTQQDKTPLKYRKVLFFGNSFEIDSPICQEFIEAGYSLYIVGPQRSYLMDMEEKIMSVMLLAFLLGYLDRYQYGCRVQTL